MDNRTRLSMKLLTSSSADIIQECRVMFGVKSVSKSIFKRRRNVLPVVVFKIIIIIIIKGIYTAQVRKGHKCAMSAEMAVWLRNCLYLYSYLSHN